MKRALVTSATVVMAAALTIGAGEAPAQADTVSARTLLSQLRTGAEREVGYDRDGKFGGFTDEDGDGCDTRAEVLLTEARKRPKVRAGCRLVGGRWRSAYDGQTVADPADLQIDHVVSLSEAWKSGAFRWSQAKRRRFTNDLGYSRTLIAVTSHSNLSKGDRGPGEWTPPSPAARCRFVLDTITVKWRWRLTVDSFERAGLGGLLNYCQRTGQSIRVKKPTRGR